MTKILIKFKISFIEFTSLLFIQLHLNKLCTFFHNGKRNANILNTGYETAKLKVWWEPTLSIFKELDCKNEATLPIYNYLDFKSEVMNSLYKRYFYFNQWENSRKPKQERYFFNGEIEINEIAKNETKALINDKIGDSDYIFLGKRIINNYFLPQIYSYFNNMDLNDEFYYIWKRIYWDPNEESLGSYCRKINMKWSMDDGKTWVNFIPEYPLISNEGIY